MEIEAADVRQLVAQAAAIATGPPKPGKGVLPRSQFASDREWLECNARFLRAHQETEARQALFDLDFMHTSADIASLSRPCAQAGIDSQSPSTEGRTAALSASSVGHELDDAWKYEDAISEMFDGSSLINYLKSNHANWRDMTPLRMFAIAQERRAMALESSFVQRMRNRMSNEPIAVGQSE